MDKLCGPSWHNSFVSDGDLDPCVQSLLLRLPPMMFVAIPWGLARLCNLRDRPVLVEWRHVGPKLTVLVVALQILLALMALLQSLVGSRDEPFFLLEYGVSAIAWSISLAVLLRERRCLMRLHPLSRIFWPLDFLSASKCVESAVSLMARGESMDDPSLVAFVRWPLSATLCYYAVVWRSRGFDEGAEPEMSTSNSSTQGSGLLSLRSPREYLIVDEEEGSGVSKRIPSAAPIGAGLWSRFMGSIMGTDEEDEPVNMSAVNHIDSGSFIRRDEPMPAKAPGGHREVTSPSTAARRAPSSHPLFGAQLSVPSATESVLHNRSVVQFNLVILITHPLYASGDSSIDAVSVWKKWGEFQGLHGMIELTAGKWSRVTLPAFPPNSSYKRSDIEGARSILEAYLHQVMLEPTFWADVAAFVRLPEKLEIMRTHAAFVSQRKPSVTSRAIAPPPEDAASNAATAGAAVGTAAVAATASSVAASPAATSQLPAVRARPDRSSQQVPFAWLLIGVSVTAWMRWETRPGSPAIVTSRRASAASVQSINEEDEDSAEASTGAAATSAAAPSTYITFQIRVRSSIGEWNTHKRLSELRELRSELARKFPAFPVPNLQIDANYERDDASLHQARRVVEIFLQSVVGTSYFECKELYTCLAEQAHPLRRVTNDRMIACSDAELLAAANPAAAAAPSGAAAGADASSSSSAAVAIGGAGIASATMAIPAARGAVDPAAPLPSTRRARPSARSSVGTNSDSPALGSSVPSASSPMLSHSLSGAGEDYFASNGAAAASVSNSSLSPSTSVLNGGTAPALARSPSLPRTPTGSKRTALPLSSPSWHSAYGSYDAGGGNDQGFSASSGSDEDTDDELAENERGSGVPANGVGSSSNGSGSGTSGGVLDSSIQSGVLPTETYAASSKQRPIGNHRFAVFISQWAFASDEASAAAAAAASTPAAPGTPRKLSSTAMAAAPPALSASGGKGKHVVYVIVVREFFELSNYLEWSVTRRYAQFDALHRSLSKQFPDQALPALPRKTAAWTKQDKAFLDARLQSLEMYLQQLINNTHFQVDEFFSFFDMNSSTRAITMGSLA